MTKEKLLKSAGSRIADLFQLRQSNALSNEEFQTLKLKIINTTTPSPTDEIADELHLLVELVGVGGLSDSEFALLKHRVLGDASGDKSTAKSEEPASTSTQIDSQIVSSQISWSDVKEVWHEAKAVRKTLIEERTQRSRWFRRVGFPRLLVSLAVLSIAVLALVTLPVPFWMRVSLFAAGLTIGLVLCTRVLKMGEPFIPRLITNLWQAHSYGERMSLLALAFWDSLPSIAKRYLNAKSGEERSSIIKTAIGGAVATALSFAVFTFAYIEVFGNHSARYMFHTILPILDSISPISDTPEITLVKQSSLSSCPTKSIEQMVVGYMSSPRWNFGQSDDDKKMPLVNAEGYISYAGKNVWATLQFTLVQNSTTFGALEFNGVPQPLMVAAQLFESMCSQAKPVESNSGGTRAPLAPAAEPPTIGAAEQSQITKQDFRKYLLGEFRQDARVAPINSDCINHMRNAFTVAIAMYKERARSAATLSAQQEILGRAALLKQAETPSLFCTVRTVDRISIHTPVESENSIRKYLDGITAQGLSDLHDQTNKWDGSLLSDSIREGAQLNTMALLDIESIIFSELFQSLSDFRSDPTARPLAIKHSMMYTLARNLLIKDGWHGVPADSTATEFAFNNAKYYLDQYPEVQSCTSTGIISCHFAFTNDAGQKLDVETSGEEDLVVRSWSLSNKAGAVSLSANSIVSNLYGNAVVAREADGTEIGRMHFDEDGAFKMVGTLGEVIVGTWTYDGRNLCQTTIDLEANSPLTQCIEFGGYKLVGEVLHRLLHDGQTSTWTLEAGRK